MRFWHVSIAVLCQCVLSFANTEIVNFSASHDRVLEFPIAENWTVIGPGTNERQWRIPPAPLHTPPSLVCEGAERTQQDIGCPYELWLALDLDNASWVSYDKFTLRISWPASHPADFYIQLYTPHDLDAYLHDLYSAPVPRSDARTTRRQYARIRLIDTGVRTPSNTSPTDPQETPLVPFVVILEPLYLGVVPASVLPALAFLLPLITIAAMLVPMVNRYLEGIAAQARIELERAGKDKAA